MGFFLEKTVTALSRISMGISRGSVKTMEIFQRICQQIVKKKINFQVGWGEKEEIPGQVLGDIDYVTKRFFYEKAHNVTVKK